MTLGTSVINSPMSPPSLLDLWFKYPGCPIYLSCNLFTLYTQISEQCLQHRIMALQALCAVTSAFFTGWHQNRLISAGLEPVLRHSKK